MRLYYVDQTYRDQMGPEEMKYPNKQLYSYNIATGDEIIIEPKKWIASVTTLTIQLNVIFKLFSLLMSNIATVKDKSENDFRININFNFKFFFCLFVCETE